MIETPIMENDFVKAYVTSIQNVTECRKEEDRPALLELGFSLDYHNFTILATSLGRRFKTAGYPQAIGEGVPIFAETLRDNVLSVALKKFYRQMRDEKMEGPLAEMYEACEYHLITLDDLLKLNFKGSVAKIEYHGGKKALDVFDGYMRKLASQCEIGVVASITPDNWDMHFDYDNVRSKFFQAPATPRLFGNILLPVMKSFYGAFQV